MNYVLYHASCNDGFCAAFVVWCVLGEMNMTYIPVQYNQPIPEMPDAESVYIVDFSYDRETLLNIEAKSIFVYDHHKTAKDALEGHDWPENYVVVFDMDRSGAQITYDELCGSGTDRPWIVDYTADRDLWKFELPNSRQIDLGVRTYEYDFETWYKLVFDTVLSRGQVIADMFDRKIESKVGQAKRYRVGGFFFVGVNNTDKDLTSDIAGELAKEHGVGVCFFVLDDHIVLSLRSRSDDHNVATIAESFGGGGHPRAAGCKVKLNQLEYLGDIDN